jgi:predicted acylesterase/phospholipase RssA
MKEYDNQIGLALSGGGFRATLFHLGVIRFLFDEKKLESVGLVSAVSGGSILAAHLILNWKKYTGTPEEFDVAAREVLNFVQTDIRGRVIRRWVLGCATIVLRFLLPKKKQWTLVNLLQCEYARLYRVPVDNFQSESTTKAGVNATATPTDAATYREATLKDLRNDRPAVRFNCTSLTTGDPCYFDQAGFGWFQEGFIREPISALGLPVAYAVTASSAFPPLFPPVEISHETLFCDQRSFDHEQRLTDGGVYDNLGIGALTAKYKEKFSGPEQRIPLGSIVISDAEGNFDSDFDTKYSFPVNRNVRANDLLMKRVSTFQLEDFESSLKAGAEGEAKAFARIKIREAIRNLDDTTVLEPEVQRTLINVRTDLDSFTPHEVTALIAHGYSKAREALFDKQLVGPNPATFSWDPLRNWGAVRVLRADEFRRANLRRWRLWSPDDPISWFTGLYALFICLLLAAPTILFALQSSADAKRAVVARQQVLTSAILQTQAIMASASNGCSGGPHGVPPEPGWPGLQSHGNSAVNALNDAKLLLAKDQISDAVQQINSAQGELDALVNSLHQSCSGGAHGEDPTGYINYLNTRAAVKESLDGLKRSLGRERS